MADPKEKFHDNIEGTVEYNGQKYSFYVDKECIFCHVCSQVAPDNFEQSEDGCHDYVYKQPENEEELLDCIEAIDQCPVYAIGDDGYDN